MAFNQWYEPSAGYPGGNAPFRSADTGGPQPVFRDQLDATRSMFRRTPDAEYPDGYAGTVNTKRQDRLRHSGSVRQDNKPYSRGVHKGERLNESDYFWPAEMQPYDGLEAQRVGTKWVPPGLLMEVGAIPTSQYGETPVSMARVGTKGVPRGGTVNWSQKGADPDRRAKLSGMLPPWGGSTPGVGVGVAYPGR